MSLLARISAAGRALFAPQASANVLVPARSIEELMRGIMAGMETTSGVSVTVESAQSITALYRGLRLIQDTVASVPLVLYRRRRTGGADPAQADPLYSILHDRPNEWQTSLEWRELKQRDLELRGNAYSLIVRGVGQRVSELIRLHPDRTTPKQDDRTLAVTYEYVRPDGRRVILQRDEVFHLRGPGDDGLTGRSVVRDHKETLGEALALREHGTRTFANGARPTGVLMPEGTARIGDDASRALREDFESLYAGVENAGRVVVLPGGIKFEPLSLSMEDAQYIESRKFSVSEIARILGVPPHKIGDLEKATFSNIEHQAIEFVTDAIVPRVTRWEQAIRRDLLDGDPDRFVKFELDGLLRGDVKSRAEALQILRRNGIINANEWRELEDWNRREDPGGDQYIIEANMAVNDGRDPAARAAAPANPSNPEGTPPQAA